MEHILCDVGHTLARRGINTALWVFHIDVTNTQTDARPIVAATARQLVAERAAAGLSIRDAAKAAGIGVSTVQRLESGARVPTLEQLAALCSAYGLSVVDLLTRAENRLAVKQTRTQVLTEATTEARQLPR